MAQGGKFEIETTGGSSSPVSSSVYTKKIDEAGSYTYIGEAVVGSATSSAVWRIKRIDESNDPDVAIEWAGTGAFDQVWDNRASLTYA